MLALLALALLLAGCRRAASGPANVVPSATPTPRSTPLPPIPTAVPVGSEANPLRLMIQPVVPGASAARPARSLQAALAEQTGLAVEVVMVASGAEALAALCSSVGGVVNAAWVDGLTFVAAAAQGCGEAVLLAERRVARQLATGETILLVAGAESGITRVSALTQGGVVCRVGLDDLNTWLIPSLMLQTGGVHPTALEVIRDYEDVTAIIEAVASGACDVAGVPASAVQAANAATRDALVTLDESVPFPFAMLVYPPDMPLDARLALTDALVAAADTAGPLRDLLRAERLTRPDEADLDDLRSFVAASGLDLAQLGR